MSRELARAARKAVEVARGGQPGNSAACLRPGRRRLMAMAVLIGVAAILVYLTMNRRADDLELFAEIDVIQKRRGCNQGQFLRQIPKASAGGLCQESRQRDTQGQLQPPADTSPQLPTEQRAP